VNFEVLSYSDQGISFAVEEVAGFVRARAWAVNIEELDVSNGPESGRDLAVIVPPSGRFVPLCAISSIVVSPELPVSAGLLSHRSGLDDLMSVQYSLMNLIND
jgi:hypothetical protein